MLKNADLDTSVSGSFMNLPSMRAPGAGLARACIVGIPFDCGTHPFRVGSREGPAAIRQQSRLVRHFHIGATGAAANPTEFLGAIDVGDVPCRPGDIEYSYPRIEHTISAILASGAIPISMGGDGAVTLPQLRAVSKQHPGVVVLHIDAHTDTYEMEGFNTATTFTRAAEEKLIDVENSFHIGARGGTFVGGVLEFGRSVGYHVIPFDEFDQDPDACMRHVFQTIGDKPVYLCFDMDVFDPSCAPGVCTPEWGGLSAKEGLKLLKSLHGLNFVAFDVNTVSPPQDVGGATAFLAATVIWECCSLAAASIQRSA
ncbi:MULTISPECIES: arginase family protein [Castellaniella]|uniref:Arginase family protein n=1 Tax=Castellaniella hirudinis TaxID=1144617 RepID=A0ABV8RX22_9BURK